MRAAGVSGGVGGVFECEDDSALTKVLEDKSCL